VGLACRSSIVFCWVHMETNFSFLFRKWFPT